MNATLRLPEPLHDGELSLRPATDADVERITQICQDPTIQRFTRVPSPYDREDAQAFVTFAAQALDEGGGAHLLVERDALVVGCVGAGIDATDHLAEIGYWTAPQARRQGVTTRAVHRLCRWLLEEVGLARLQLQAATTNIGSNRVAERLGFQREGTRRSALQLTAIDGLPAERVDATMWGLLPGELRPPMPARP